MPPILSLRPVLSARYAAAPSAFALSGREGGSWLIGPPVITADPDTLRGFLGGGADVFDRELLVLRRVIGTTPEADGR